MEPSHKVTVTITGKYIHGENTRAHVEMDGNGDIDHMISAFRAALYAAGFHAETIDEYLET